MNKLKYKVGDKVRIKSIDWYNKYKDEDGVVFCGEFDFVLSMKKFCSEILTIYEDVDDGYLMLEDYHGYVWTDEMIESLVERNGKTYPYKIGDRVVLKGNNRCATITDLKYNSWGNLSYYVKIDNDKDISIDYPTDLLLPYDNVVERFMEEEDLNLKFNAGDRVFNKVTRKWVNIIEFDIETGLYIVRYDDGIQGRSLESELCETLPNFKEIKEVVKKKAEVYINSKTQLDGLSKSLLYEGFVDGMMTALIEMEE